MPSTYTNLLLHVIFSTKERRRVIRASLREPLYKYMGGILRTQGNVLLEIGGVEDHVHLAIRMRPDFSVADVLRDLKASSSKWMNEEKRTRAWPSWQTGYAAFTVSESRLGVLRKYIRNQEEHHRTVSFQEELIAFLRKHRVQYDPAYLWD